MDYFVHEVPLKKYFEAKDIDKINVLFSLYQSTYESTDFDSMEIICNSYAELIVLIIIRNNLLTPEFHENVNFADLFDTFEFENGTVLDKLFFVPILREGKKMRGYKKVINTIEKESLFRGSLEYRKLFHETSKNLVENILERLRTVKQLE